MEMELLDPESLCRACLSPAAEFAGSPEGGPRDLRLQLVANMFLYCTSLPVEEGAETEATRWPHWVCGACYELLAAACRFKRQCVRSHRALRTHLRSSSSAEPEVKLEHGGSEETDSRLNEDICVDGMDGMDGIADSPHSLLLDYITTKKKCEGIKEHRVEEKKLKPEHGKNGAVERRRLSCDVCGRSFVLAARLAAHRLLRHRTHPHPPHPPHQHHHQAVGCGFASLTCDTCGKVCKSERTLRRHRDTHAPRASAVCHVCGRAFKSSIILQGHLETHKENRERSHACAHCDKRFYSAGLLSTHVSRLHRGRRFICQVCSFAFANKYSLSKHLGRHAGLKPHQCELCQKRYSTHSFLAEHRRTHTGEKPFACTHCSKAFVSSKRLRDHVRTHTGEKPHKCGRCEQSFVQRGTLTRHMRVHDKRSPISPPLPPSDLTHPL